MTNQQHPITPPKDLLQQLRSSSGSWLDHITNAYRAGADQELEACCEWMQEMQVAGSGDIEILRAARRPKPPSPKEEALRVLENLIETRRVVDPEYQVLRYALEALPND